MIYDFLLLIYGIVTLPVLAAKGKLREGFRERQGHLPPDAPSRLEGKKVIWIHAVSVGEVRLAMRLIERLTQREPRTKVLLTTTTASSQQIARKAAGPETLVTFCPFDLSWMMRRFITAAQPSAIVIMETEIWPNLLRLAQQKNIPVIIVNARLSDRAYPVYRRWRVLVRSAFGRVTRCLAQSLEHARRFGDIGVSESHIRVTGNMKYDLEAPALLESVKKTMTAFRADSLSILLAASTHPGEEAQVLEAFAGVRVRVPDAKLVIAPRHLERLAEVEEIIRRKGFKCAKISGFDAPAAEAADVLLVDAWGILNQLYALAEIVFVGGSLTPVGGHNLAEPAVAGAAVLHGPWMQNFRDMEEEFRTADASVRVADVRELELRATTLFLDPAARRALAARSRAVVAANAGATDRNLEEILTWSSKK